MSSISWEKYIEYNFQEFRTSFKKLQENQKRIAEEVSFAYSSSLNAPCQVLVVEISSRHPTCIVVMHNANLPDKALITLEKVPPDEIQTRLIQESKLSKWIGEDEVASLAKDVHRMASDAIKDDTYWVLISTGFPEQRGMIYLFRGDLLYTPDPLLFSKMLFKDMMSAVRDIAKEQQREKIEETVSDIKKEAGTIPLVELRDKIIKSTVKLEKHIKQIEDIDKKQEKLEHEMTGVRRLIGSRTFGEWKVLLSEIDKLNTRIDALSNVKDAYDKVLAQQGKLLEQQSSFVNWIKYATILVPIAVVLVPIIDALIRHFLNIP